MLTSYVTRASTFIKREIYKRRGFFTNRHIVVIESDDWGCMTVPNKEVYKRLIEEGIRMEQSHYSKYDTLESSDDVEGLLDVLDSVRDSNGSPAVMTLNYLVANPNYEIIKDCGFESYYYETIDKTYERYFRGDVVHLIIDGMKKGLVLPQLHGREHLNIFLWLKYLKEGFDPLKKAFDNRMFAVVATTVTQPMDSVKRSMYPKSVEELEINKAQIRDGLKLFKDIWGYESESFIAPNYAWHPLVEDTLICNGIKYLQGGYRQQYYDFNNQKNVVRYHYMGERLDNGLICSVRNVEFEPSECVSKAQVDSVLRQVSDAFRMGKPCIISTHRVNYCGGLDITNRDRSFGQLRELLNSIVRFYPDVEFMSSTSLFNLMEKDLEK